MSKVCSICGKGNMSGNHVSHSHRKTPRSLGANVQKIRIIKDGKPTSAYVCTQCIKSGKVDRA